MNFVDFNFGNTAKSERLTYSGTSISVHYIVEKLMFLFSQLDPSLVEPIILNVESAFGVSSSEEHENLSIKNKYDAIGSAVTRFLYAVTGQSSEDIAFAFTCAQIRAIQLGADDCDTVEVYS
jgi:hypothetical protein